MDESGSGPPAGHRLRGFAAWLGVVLCLGLLLFCYRYLAVLAEGGSEDFRKPLLQEMTAVLGAGLLFFGVRWWVRRYPLERGSWSRRLPLYAALVLLFSALHTTSNWGLRELAYRLAGLGDYDYGIMPLRYLMELPVDVLALSLVIAALHAARSVREAREQQLHAARLESSLARAQLSNLRLQLQPHFLFNTLHAISATMYEDPAAADSMIEGLADLLRASLDSAGRDEVPLAEELALLEHYLAILRLRFGERLAVSVCVDEAVREVLVPPLLLQPLVENAVRHGGVEKLGRGEVTVRARLTVPQEAAAGPEEQLLLEVEDDGPGCPAEGEAPGAGLGLSATAERLRRLHGGSARFEAGNLPGVGFRVALRLPARRTSPREAP